MNPKFIILGSGAGHTVGGRNSSSYLLEYKNRLCLFDCGSGSLRSFLSMGYDPLSIDNIFISHMHIDHIGDLLLYIQKFYLLKRAEKLCIHMPAEGIEIIQKYMKACYLFEEKFLYELSFIPMEPMISLYEDNISIKPIANRHLFRSYEAIEKYKITGLDNQMQSFSFKIYVKDKTLLYSADLESLDDIEKDLDNLDLLIVETTHIDLIKLRELPESRNVRRVVLTHIAEDSIEALQTLAQSRPDKFILAEDNLTLDI
ncbi:MAG: MBL fold metallo-hydrolase [Candidatus Zixiibacteriota bacterium]